MLSGSALSSSLGGKHVALKYPKFDYAPTRRVADGVSSEAGLNGSVQYSGSFPIESGKQDYDLQSIIGENFSEMPTSKNFGIDNGTYWFRLKIDTNISNEAS